MNRLHRSLGKMICVSALVLTAAQARASDITLEGNQFANQFANGYACNNVGNVVNNQTDDAVFPDNMANPGWGHANAQNISISAGSYKPDGTFEQHSFNAIGMIRIWTLCTDAEKQRIPSQIAINYTTANNVAWNNWYTTGDKSSWPLPVTISSVNGKPVKANADGSVTLYDGKENAFIGTMPGTDYKYVDVGVDIPAGTSSVFFQFGPQGPTNAGAPGQTYGDRIAEIQTVPVAASATPAASPANILIQSGQKLAFLGDSITQFGWESQLGYVKLVAMGLAANGVKIAPIPAGISGNTSSNMAGRFDADVINRKPDWVTISCGVNDVWHNPGGVALEDYEKNITQMVDKAQAAGVKVVILTATMIGEDQPNGNNQRLIPYNDFLRKLAKDRNYPLADLNADMQAQVQERIKGGWQPGHLLTVDGVHMNPRGDVMMADGILRAFGLNDAQIAKAHDSWLDIPNGWSANLTYQVTVNKTLTLRQYLALQDKIAKGSAGSIQDYLQPMLSQEAADLLFPNDKDGVTKLQKQLQDKLDHDVDQQLKQ